MAMFREKIITKQDPRKRDLLSQSTYGFYFNSVEARTLQSREQIGNSITGQ